MTAARTLLAIALLSLTPLTARSAEHIGFRYDGETYFGEQMPAPIRQKLFELEEEMNERRLQIIDQYVVRQYLKERAAASNGKSATQLEEELLAVPQPDAATIRQFYDQNKAEIGRPFEQVKDEVARYIVQQQGQEKVRALIDEIKKEKGYAVALPTPEPPRFDIDIDGYPAKGNPGAKVTLVEFADYQCPYCKSATRVVEHLLDRFGDKVRFVYRDFPINPSGISQEIAKGAVCADQQGAFWDYHNLAFERQGTLLADSPLRLASDLLLDTSRFQSCLYAPGTAAKVARSKDEAMSLGLSGTPTFFVNGRQLHAHGEIEKPLVEAVEKAVADAP